MGQMSAVMSRLYKCRVQSCTAQSSAAWLVSPDYNNVAGVMAVSPRTQELTAGAEVHI